MNTPAALTEGPGCVPASILIVDDLPDRHLAFRSILQELGEHIVSARSGREALARLLEQEFAVILLDVNMPDIDGLETASLIRTHRRSARTPILFITAHVDEMQARRGYALGAVDYISSPVVPQVLCSKVRVFVELFRMHREIQLRAAEREALARAEAARAAAEDAVTRADFLAQASQALSRSLDLAQTRRTLMALVVPRLVQHALLVEAGQEPQGLCASLRQAIAGALADGQVVQWQDAAQAATVLPLGPGDGAAGALVLLGPPPSLDASRLALAREVASRAAIAMENARLYAAVREADRRKNEFLAMLAHELRNPLAPIRNAVHIMQGDQVQAQALARARDVISRQADHMARLIDDLLDVSRIVQGKVTVRPERLRLADVIERCVESTAPRLSACGQTLCLDLPAQDVFLQGDAVRLAQVLSNLVSNASKFSPTGAAIDLNAQVDGGQLRLSVRDRGYGISAAVLPQIFDLFVQGEQSLDRAQGGLGVGLTLVRHLVELHGGRVEAFSDGLGKGTEVVVHLPMLAGAPHQPQPQPSVAEPAAQRPATRAGRAQPTRVLVVDDLAESAETLTVLLQMEGFQVRVAADGASALKQAEAFEPHAVLLDIGLPGMSGFEVAGRLRQHPATAQALLVALTGYGEADSRRRSAEAGFDIHLVKPADVDQLLSLLADPRLARKPAMA